MFLYVPIWTSAGAGTGTLLFAPNGGKVSPPPSPPPAPSCPQLVKGTFMGMVYLREELFRGLSQAHNGGVCVVAVFVALCRVFGDKSWDSGKVLTRQSVSESV